MRGIHNDNQYLKMLALNQSLAQAAAEAGKDRQVDRARAEAAQAVEKQAEAAKDAEKKKLTLGSEQTGDGNQQGPGGYLRRRYSKNGKEDWGDQGPPPPGAGRIDIRV
jgi:hypothetical protein